jgi:ferredoxin-NADP reductase/Na+-translocating ferredoxin:NAD+ oxidoreductase RnfD subunit
MLTLIDNFLNRITMYRLMLYFLLAIVFVAIIFCFTGLLSYSGWHVISSFFILSIVSYFSNLFLGGLFKVPTNVESSAVTAAILTLILTPGSPVLFLILVGILSQAVKYLFAYKGAHIFNPAAIAAILSILLLNQGASWWIGYAYLLPLIVIGGLLVTRKTQRFDLVLSFLIVHLTILAWSSRADDPVAVIQATILNSSLLFFAFVMVTEPLTSPPGRLQRIIYGALIGFLLATPFTIGKLYSSPELALVLGNIFSFLVRSKERLRLVLKSKNQIAKDTYEFVFRPNRKLVFEPGQYLEWTLPVTKPDSRGNRRYFTIASSPTEEEIRLGAKFYEKPSAFKQTLLALESGSMILAGQLSGNFTLPQNKETPLIFIAGGIGITPFRSILKYLIDNNESRPITLFYAANSEDEFAYSDLLSQAESTGVLVIRTTERLNTDMIAKVSNYKDSLFYISGPRGMIVAFESTLRSMGIPKSHIKIDFFPGYV